MKINWNGFATTKGRQVYASALGRGEARNINYQDGFLIGWDTWSDGRFTLYPTHQDWLTYQP